MVRCILLDVGECILAYKIAYTVLKKLCRFAGKDEAKVKELLGTDFGDSRSLIWRFDAGEISDDEFIDEVRRLLGIGRRITSSSIAYAFRNCYKMPKGTEELLRYLSERFVLGIISNMNHLQWAHIEERFPVLAEGGGVFHFHVLSFREHLMKPDQRIYGLAFEKAREIVSLFKSEHGGGRVLERSDCIFLDDRKDNVFSAREFGIQAVRVSPASKSGYWAIADALEGAGIPIPRRGSI